MQQARESRLQRRQALALPAMAPRSRSRSAQAASSTAGPVGIADLPDDVLQRCLGFLDLRERCAGRAWAPR